MREWGIGRTRIGGLVLAAFTAAAAGAMLAPSEGHAADPTPENVLVVSDSAFAGVRWFKTESAFQGASFRTDLQSCRRLVYPSCGGREMVAPPTALSVIEAKASGNTTLVMLTGYNDWSSRFRSDLDKIMAAARAKGIVRVLWATYRTDVDYVSPNASGLTGDFKEYAIMNGILESLAGTPGYEDLVVLDWRRYTKDHNEWFTTDGVHFRVEAAWAGADVVSRKLAFLDGRACPQPRVYRDPLESPCPDPDAVGFAGIDLAGLYPLDPNSLLCYTPSGAAEYCAPDGHPYTVDIDLKYGDNNQMVVAVRLRLKRLGYSTPWSVSLFDSGLRTKVRAFQRDRGLRVTGIVDAQTRAALGFDGSSPPVDTSCSVTKQLSFGMSGVSVNCLERTLRAKGYQTQYVDSYYGSHTRDTGVKNAERALRLPVDGVADPTLLDKLGIWGGGPIDPPAPTPTTGCTVTRQLSLGTSGTQVNCLERTLQSKGYQSRYVDSYFGSYTRDVGVKNAERALRLPVDGVADPALLDKLGIWGGPGGVTTPAPSTARELRKGDRGDDVKVLQQALKSAGFDPGPVDGWFGSKTRTALRAFQRSHRLTADGIAGPATRTALGI